MESKSKLLHLRIQALEWREVYDMLDEVPGLVNYTSCESCIDDWEWVRGATPLFHVTELFFKEKCSIVVAEELLKRGADPNKGSVYEGFEAYPLYFCAIAVPGQYDEAIEMGNLLIKHGAHINGMQSMLNMTIDRMLRSPYGMDDATMVSFFCRSGTCARSKQRALVDILQCEKPWEADVVNVLLEHGTFLYGTSTVTPYLCALHGRTETDARIRSLHAQLEEIKTFHPADFVRAVHHSRVLDAPLNQWRYYIRSFDAIHRALKRDAFATTMIRQLNLLPDTHRLVKEYLSSELAVARLKKWAIGFNTLDQSEL
jgi:hypothetical protein